MFLGERKELNKTSLDSILHLKIPFSYPSPFHPCIPFTYKGDLILPSPIDTKESISHKSGVRDVSDVLTSVLESLLPRTILWYNR